MIFKAIEFATFFKSQEFLNANKVSKFLNQRCLLDLNCEI